MRQDTGAVTAVSAGDPDGPSEQDETWPWLGRGDQLRRIVVALADPASGPVVVTGPRGIGRTSIARRAVAALDPDRHAVLTVSPAGTGPCAAIARHLPGSPPVHPLSVAGLRAAATALCAPLAPRRPVLVIDDAERVDLASLLVARQAHRQHAAAVLVVCPSPAVAADPADCLRYEPNIRSVDLPPLTRAAVADLLTAVGLAGAPGAATVLHAMTDGHPGRLRRLLGRQDLTGALTAPGCGGPVPATEPAPPVPVADPVPPEDLRRLVAATATCWSRLDVAATRTAGDLAQRLGVADRVVAPRAGALLLSGQAAQADRLLAAVTEPDSDDLDDAERCRMVVTRAMVLALGLRRHRRADDLLRAAAARTPSRRRRLLAYRAWLLGLGGRTAEADALLAGLPRDGSADPEADLMVAAATANEALAAGRPGDAVRALRRGLAVVDAVRHALPWLRPYLTGCLIDALLLAGRTREAATLAGEFHAGRSGWDAAVAVATLAAGLPLPTALPARVATGTATATTPVPATALP